MTTIADVAKRAGVSPVTVSRVMNDSTKVHPLTREKVERAIAELHYVPSVAARSLRSKRTHALALLVPDITNPFWTTVARGVEDAAQSMGYSVLLCNTDESASKQQHYIDVIISQRVDGVIIAPYHSDARKLKKLQDRQIPTVVVDRRVKGWQVDTVIGDSIAGAHALVKHLIELGHRRIAALSGPKNTSSAEDRIFGYRLALAEARIDFESRLVRRGEYKAASGAMMTEQILAEDPPPTAIFAANNSIALGVLETLSRRKLRIPQDIALVCFDDIPHLSSVFPFLTVVAQPVYELGLVAARLLLSRLNGRMENLPSQVVLPTCLIIRYSCGSRQKEFNLLPWTETLQEEMIPVRPLEEPRSSADSAANASVSALL